MDRDELIARLRRLKDRMVANVFHGSPRISRSGAGDEIAAILAALESRPAPTEGRYRHKKRGTIYTLIGVGRAQGTLNDEDPVVLYRGDDGGLWVRHHVEFCDGRFEKVATETHPVSGGEQEAIEAPENGETDPEWRAIRRAIDQFAGRVPVVGKHRAIHNTHIAQTVERLDEIGEREAADTIVWLCWHRALDRERERFLLADAQERIEAAEAKPTTPERAK